MGRLPLPLGWEWVETPAGDDLQAAGISTIFVPRRTKAAMDATIGGGEYEKHLTVFEPVQNREKRLLSAMQWGCPITSAHGHRWLYSFEVDELDKSLDAMLFEQGYPAMRAKVYGSIEDALDRIDGALKVLGKPSLLASYCPEVWHA